MGKCVPRHHRTEQDAYKRAQGLLADCIIAKNEHKKTKNCIQEPGGSPDHRCVTCHWWAGAINALEEVIYEI